MRLSAEQARCWFGGARVARLATSDGTRPHLVPVTFAARGDQVVTAVDHKPKSGRRLRRLRIIEANPRVSLLADHYEDADWSRLWWVRADGTAAISTAAEHPELVRALCERYEQYRRQPPSGELIVVTVETWSGWSGGA
ncbi:TIGR03668 family PPOX class F420-dependent oxidoreductase [Salinifilum aidingensis]